MPEVAPSKIRGVYDTGTSRDNMGNLFSNDTIFVTDSDIIAALNRYLLPVLKVLLPQRFNITNLEKIRRT